MLALRVRRNEEREIQKQKIQLFLKQKIQNVEKSRNITWHLWLIFNIQKEQRNLKILRNKKSRKIKKTIIMKLSFSIGNLNELELTDLFEKMW